MAEYIDKDKLENYAMGCVGGSVTIRQIHEFSAEDVAPVKHGEWISPPKRKENVGYRNGFGIYYECSECGFIEDYHAKYCAYCGARMDGE